MGTFQDLWFDYGRDRRPANIGAVIDGIRIGDIDDEIQDVAGSFAGLRSEIDSVRVARLGLALEQLYLVLPALQPPETRAYFERLAGLAHAAPLEIANREA